MSGNVQQSERRERFISPMSLVVQYSITLIGVLTVTAVIAALTGSWGLMHSLVLENPGTLFIVVVAGAAVAFGAGPASVALVASFLILGLFFRGQETLQRLVVLLVTMLLIVLLAERQRRGWQRAERTQARLSAILESMSDAVTFVGATGAAEDLNGAAQRLHDASARSSAHTARMDSEINTPWPDEDAFMRALAGESDVRAMVTIPHGDASARTVSVVANPVRDTVGRIIGAVSVSREVTDAVRATAERERLLAQVEAQAAQLEASFAATVDAVAIYDAQGQTLRRNAANRRLLGLDADYNGDRFDIVRRVNMRHPDGRPLLPEELHTSRALRGETVSGEVLLITDATGQNRYLRQNASPMYGADGTIIGVVLVTNDITEERARAAERDELLALVEARRRFAQTIFDSVPVGLAVLDAHTLQYQAVNPAYIAAAPEAYHGQDLYGLTLTQVFPNAREGTLIPRLEAVVETGKVSVERAVPLLDPEGRRTYWDEILVPLSADATPHRFVLLQQMDVTGQIEAGQNIVSLAAATAQRAGALEAVISSVPDGIAIGSADGHVLQMNAAAERILGSNVVIGQELDEIVSTLMARRPDGTPVLPEELPIARAARGETFSGQELLLAIPGGEVVVSCGGAPIRGLTGEITGTVVIWSDVTERKRTEGLMTRLGHIVDTSSNEVYILDAQNWRIMQANEGARRNLGYDEAAIMARTLLDLAPGLTEDTLGLLVYPLWTDEQAEVVWELQFTRRDGTTYPVEMQLYLSRTETPSVFVVIAQDITERHTALRQREALFREVDERRRFAQTVIDTAPTGIAVFSPDDTFTVRSANAQYARLFDEPWRSRGVVGQASEVFMTDAETSGILTIYRQVRESGEPVFMREFAYGGAARGMASFDWSLVPLREDGVHVTGLLLLINDVTERVRSRQRIEELAWDAAQRANELEITLASITDGVIMTDATGQVTLENAAAKRLLGADRVVTLAASGLTTGPQSVLAATMPLAQALRGETVEDQELLTHDQDTHAARYLLCSSAPVRATDDAITGAVAVFRDITATKQIEQMKDEFISVAAHELRTPLTAIKGYAELLERRLGGDEARMRERQSLAVIRKQAERLARLVNEMLDVSRIEGGWLQLNRELFDLSALAVETTENLRVGNDRHVFVLDVPPDVTVYADPSRIEQVLINLVANAVAYSPDGSTVTMRVRATDNRAIISVTDEGIGIAPEEVPRLFSRFYRASQADVLRGGGMGLGLYISYEIVERHGGAITVESTPGAGSTFTLSLPNSKETRETERQ